MEKNNSNIKLIDTKNIKAVNFNLNNEDTISIPYQCFNEFNCGIDKKVSKECDDTICSHLFCDIEDNGLIEFINTFPGNLNSPIQILNQNTISSIIIIYNDDTEQYICTSSYYDEHEECYTVNQDTEMLTYKNIHITVKPYIKSYFIYEIFNLPINTLLKDDTENTYIILLDENSNKYLATHEYKFPISINETTVQAKYYLCD
jgi:hypothetical protein